ncbi:hypothetical protein G9A89_018505 [Geosiphon pyriformis]|nr:hypothetical protein G9A89_018505 [Geosiphon pyriformis]
MKSYMVFVIGVSLVMLMCCSLSEQAAFNYSNVPIEQRAVWCDNQSSSCVNLCNDSGNNAQDNRCDPETLQFRCLCTNGFAPNSSEYTQTIPFFLCTNEVEACKADCTAGNQGCTDACAKNCTASSPKKYNTTSNPSAFGTSVQSPTSTPSSSQNILSQAANLSSSTINALFVVFFTVIIVMFSRL